MDADDLAQAVARLKAVTKADWSVYKIVERGQEDIDWLRFNLDLRLLLAALAEA